MRESQIKFVPPSINETAFNCPHCGALAKQAWFALQGDELRKDNLPLRLTEEDVKTKNRFKEIEDEEERAAAEAKFHNIARGIPIIQRRKYGGQALTDIYNANVSTCFNCNEIAIWSAATMVWPIQNNAPTPNRDLPDDVRLDFEEAGRIMQLSPRGAAALLRLAIQKLFKELGGKGSNIDEDIAALVKKGLDVRIQQALDIVRVIGNNAVHPGQIDLRDDVATAKQLFDLVNIIADTLISQPKNIAKMFNALPERSLAAIAKRDGKS